MIQYVASTIDKSVGKQAFLLSTKIIFNVCSTFVFIQI